MGKEKRMSVGGKETEEKKDEMAKKGEKVEGKISDRMQKRPWDHIIDKDAYSSGPGDNIYVFG
jgi:hypothetical protein